MQEKPNRDSRFAKLELELACAVNSIADIYSVVDQFDKEFKRLNQLENRQYTTNSVVDQKVAWLCVEIYDVRELVWELRKQVKQLMLKNREFDLEVFKVNFLNELEALLNEQDSEPQKDTGDLFDLLGTSSTQSQNKSLQHQLDDLAQRVSKIEFALGYEKAK